MIYYFCSYQEAIEDITKRMGAGMAKFICKEVWQASLIFSMLKCKFSWNFWEKKLTTVIRVKLFNWWDIIPSLLLFWLRYMGNNILKILGFCIQSIISNVMHMIPSICFITAFLVLTFNCCWGDGYVAIK